MKCVAEVSGDALWIHATKAARRSGLPPVHASQSLATAVLATLAALTGLLLLLAGLLLAAALLLLAGFLLAAALLAAALLAAAALLTALVRVLIGHLPISRDATHP
jgi:hypothetical protein